MCGFVGCFGEDLQRHQLREAIGRGLDAIVNRGPDDYGIFIEEASGVALGHRRLAIVDVSTAGHQPMVSDDGDLVLAFNGEIYNHVKVRKQIEREGHKSAWIGHSDTETLLAAFAAWGAERTLKCVSGMFALALWDGRARTILLARDRFGEKPLFYSIKNGRLLFGSDLASFRHWPDLALSLNNEAAAAYMQSGWVPGSKCIISGFQKLQPGTWLTVSEKELSGKRMASPRPYWSLLEAASNARRKGWGGSYADAVEELESLLREAVAGQMIADVPLGAFLSGGIDSTLVVACMQMSAQKTVRTYSIGFKEKEFDEAPIAKRVAALLGTEHTELYIGIEDLRAIVPELGAVYAEPFADASQIPMLMLARLTRKHVKVALSGDGGDELFGGYSRHVKGSAVWRKSKSVPVWIRSIVGRAVCSVSADRWDAIYSRAETLLPGRWHVRLAGVKMRKVGAALGARELREFYAGMLVANMDHVLNESSVDWKEIIQQEVGDLTAEEYMMLCDSIYYLPGDVLVKVDQSTMAASLESRAPFLNESVAEFAWRLPVSFRIKDGLGKRILRDVLSRHIPASLVARPKTGFTPPLGKWLRYSIRPWAEALLDKRKLDDCGLFDGAAVRQLWERYVSGQPVDDRVIWNVLMFQAWREKWIA